MLGLTTTNWVVIGVASSFFWLILSIRILRPNEIGAREFLGKKWGEFGSGPHFVPYPISEMNIFPTGGIEVEVPGEPKDIQEEHPDDLKGDKLPPMRVNFVGYKKARWYSEDLSSYQTWEEYRGDLSEDELADIEADSLQRPLAAKVHVVLQWRAMRGKIFQLMEAIGKPKNGDYVSEIERRLQDKVNTHIEEIVAHMTVRHAIQMKGAISRKLKEIIEEEIGEHIPGDSESEGNTEHGKAWGIVIDWLNVKDIEAGHTVNAAMAEASAAPALRDKEIAEAQGRAEAIRLEGDARRDAEIARGEGEAEAIRLVREQIKAKGGKWAAALQSAERAMEKSRYVVLPTDGGMVASIAAMAKGAIDSMDSTEK